MSDSYSAWPIFSHDVEMRAAARVDMVCRVCRNQPCYSRPAVCEWCRRELAQPMPWSPYP